MSTQENFEYIRPVDFAAIEAAGPDKRISQHLLEYVNDAKHCTLQYTRTPAGGGTPLGLHYHKVDQIFYVLSGTMFIEIDGTTSTVEAGNAVIFPAGVPHKNWNETETVHLAIYAPVPAAGEQISYPVPG